MLIQHPSSYTLIPVPHMIDTHLFSICCTQVHKADGKATLILQVISSVRGDKNDLQYFILRTRYLVLFFGAVFILQSCPPTPSDCMICVDLSANLLCLYTGVRHNAPRTHSFWADFQCFIDPQQRERERIGAEILIGVGTIYLSFGRPV